MARTWLEGATKPICVQHLVLQSFKGSSSKIWSLWWYRCFHQWIRAPTEEVNTLSSLRHCPFYTSLHGMVVNALWSLLELTTATQFKDKNIGKILNKITSVAVERQWAQIIIKFLIQVTKDCCIKITSASAEGFPLSKHLSAPLSLKQAGTLFSSTEYRHFSETKGTKFITSMTQSHVKQVSQILPPDSL